MKFRRDDRSSEVKPELDGYGFPKPPKPSLWERFDAAERERRLDDFVAAEQQKFKDERAELPSVTSRPNTCGRCGQAKAKHKISTSPSLALEYEVVVKEADGEAVLSKDLYYSSRYTYPMVWGKPERLPVRVFLLEDPMSLRVECECGNRIGSYRPLDAE